MSARTPPPRSRTLPFQADEPFARMLLRAMFDAAVASAQPALTLAQHLPSPPAGRTVVVGAGKASGAMAQALEAAWSGPLSGVVVVPAGYASPSGAIDIIEAAHPVPDARSEIAARRCLAAVQDLTADDLVIALISGGGSALLALPADGIALADKQAIGRALLRSGASIQEMNCVRKHLSAVKAGRLAAAAYPARVVTLLISDVPGDDAATIASGPTLPDPTTSQDALAILSRYGIAVPANVSAHLKSPASETPKSSDERLAGAEARLIATPRRALEAAAEVARACGVEPIILGDAIEGEASRVGTEMAAHARRVALFGEPPPPCVLLSGGETTVTVRGEGRGGRNVEFLLALALSLDGLTGVYALACDTDGVDGTEPIAGAVVTQHTLARAALLGIDAQAHLSANDAHSFFDALGDQVITGPTRTNVNDFRAILIAGAPDLPES